MVIVFVCGGLEMAGEVTTSRIASICLRNRTESCSMSAMVESPSFKNGGLGAGFCKAYVSCFASSMTLSAGYGKGMVK